MSRIEELIQQHCPEGVEYRQLVEICNKITTGKLNANAMVEGGEYPFFTCDEKQFRIDKYSFDTEAILISGNGSQVGHINYYKGKFNAYQRTYVLHDFSTSINIRFFLFYAKAYLRAYIFIHSKKGSVPYITLPMLQNFSIPTPPLEIQNEIVKTLDLFTELEAELEAELEVRKKQYTYYRDALFNSEGKNVEWKAMGEIGHFTRGKRFVKADIVSEGIPCIHYGEMYTHYDVWAKEAKSFLKPELAARLRVAKTGDVIIVAAGETIEDIGLGVAWLGEEDVVIHDACFAYSHNMHPNYVSHFLQTDLFHSQIIRHISSGKISAINAAGLSKAKIPVPPIEEQRRIASILDKFHTLINDMSIGIPAEIEGRRKQFEYYRNQLLGFKNVNNG